MNATGRKKNKIKSEKKMESSCNIEELEEILKKEFMDLINEPYLESIKRERYRKLEPLIREYQNQKGMKQKNTRTSSNNETLDIYHKQIRELKNNPVYQELSMNSHNINKSVQNNTKHRNQRAIEAYEKQMVFTKTTHFVQTQVASNVNEKEHSKVAKKGFFRRIFELFRKIEKTPIPKSEPMIKVSKPQVTQEKKKYTAVPTKNQYVYNEFEKALRNFQNYSQENPNYKQIKNGHVIKYEPRYL